MSRILLSALSAFVLVISAAAEDTTQRTLQFQPLEAKKISIRTAARVDSAIKRTVSAGEHRRQAWAYFDNREWDKATDAFLSALEKDPENVESAEGLAMSVYRAGDYASAHRLGEELREVMPTVARIVSETVLADVRYMVKEGEFAAADEFLTHFPSVDGAYAEARTLVRDAGAIRTALGPDGESVADPSRKVASN